MIEAIFLSVGAMKAGTTWLHQQLATHPDIHFCPEKEIHYFADTTGQNYMSMQGRLNRFQQVVRNLESKRVSAHVRNNLAWYANRYLAQDVNDDWYAGLFDKRPPRKKDARYVADFSNLYCGLDAAGWAHVHSVAKDVRAIYTMRHPSKRLWSHLKFSYEFSGRGAELAHLKKDDLMGFLADPHNHKIGDYTQAVKDLKLHLAEDKIGFHFFENVRDNPIDTLKTIEDFLGVENRSYAAEKISSRVNASQVIDVPTVFADAAEEIRLAQIAGLQSEGLVVPEAWHQPMV